MKSIWAKPMFSRSQFQAPFVLKVSVNQHVPYRWQGLEGPFLALGGTHSRRFLLQDEFRKLKIRSGLTLFIRWWRVRAVEPNTLKTLRILIPKWRWSKGQIQRILSPLVFNRWWCMTILIAIRLISEAVSGPKSNWSSLKGLHWPLWKRFPMESFTTHQGPKRVQKRPHPVPLASQDVWSSKRCASMTIKPRPIPVFWAKQRAVPNGVPRAYRDSTTWVALGYSCSRPLLSGRYCVYPVIWSRLFSIFVLDPRHPTTWTWFLWHRMFMPPPTIQVFQPMQFRCRQMNTRTMMRIATKFGWQRWASLIFLWGWGRRKMEYSWIWDILRLSSKRSDGTFGNGREPLENLGPSNITFCEATYWIRFQIEIKVCTKLCFCWQSGSWFQKSVLQIESASIKSMFPIILFVCWPESQKMDEMSGKNQCH